MLAQSTSRNALIAISNNGSPLRKSTPQDPASSKSASKGKKPMKAKEQRRDDVDGVIAVTSATKTEERSSGD
jgi:hypothetical protein